METEKTVWDFLVKKVRVKFLENVPEFVGVEGWQKNFAKS